MYTHRFFASKNYKFIKEKNKNIFVIFVYLKHFVVAPLMNLNISMSTKQEKKTHKIYVY